MTHQEKLEAQAAAAAAESAVDVAAVADGTYEGTGMGYGGKMVLSVTVEGGAITGVEVLENAETPTIGGLALPEYCAAVAGGIRTELPRHLSGSEQHRLRGFQAATEDIALNAQRCCNARSACRATLTSNGVKAPVDDTIAKAGDVLVDEREPQR